MIEFAASASGPTVATPPKLKITAATAQELSPGVPLSGKAQALLDPKIPPLAFVEALSAQSLYTDAVQFLSRALPKREAVWWCCLCSRDLPEDAKRPELAGGIGAAEAWVFRPNEENRRKAESAANAITASHPARWTAMAAFWSGGSMAPPEAPEAKPAEDFTAKAVAGAILMAAALDPLETDARNRRFLGYGLDIAKGGTGRPPART